MKNYSINIIGAGAVGHLWYSFLRQAGNTTRLFARAPRAPKTLKVNSPIKNFSCQIEYHTLAGWQDCDAIIIAVKAFQLEALCLQMQQKLKPKVPIVLMMNGGGLLDIMQTKLPNNPVLQASLVQGALLSNDQLLHTGAGLDSGGDTLVGDFNGNIKPSTFTALIKTLDNALPPVKWNTNHRQTMMLKLIVNAIINPVTALYQLKNGQLVNNNQLIPQAEQLVSELASLLPELDLRPSLTLAAVRKTIIQVASATANNTSSMLQDVQKQQETEIDFINGYLVKLAASFKIELKAHQHIISRIKSLKNNQ